MFGVPAEESRLERPFTPTSLRFQCNYIIQRWLTLKNATSAVPPEYRGEMAGAAAQTQGVHSPRSYVRAAFQCC